MKESDDWRCRIISAIMHNGNVEDLLYGTHTLDDLMVELHSLETAGFIIKENRTYKTTELGEKILADTNREKRGIYKYVYEDQMYRMERLDLEAIYIPRKRRRRDN